MVTKEIIKDSYFRSIIFKDFYKKMVCDVYPVKNVIIYSVFVDDNHVFKSDDLDEAIDFYNNEKKLGEIQRNQDKKPESANGFYNCFCDGACKGNPGEMGIGVVIKKDGILAESISKRVGFGTNNQAEYISLIECLNYLKKQNIANATINMDSKLVVDQISGNFKVRDANLQILHTKAKNLIDSIGCKKIKLLWIQRNMNNEADRLSNRCFQN